MEAIHKLVDLFLLNAKLPVLYDCKLLQALTVGEV